MVSVVVRSCGVSLVAVTCFWCVINVISSMKEAESMFHLRMASHEMAFLRGQESFGIYNNDVRV